ncbi:hypothetical protein ACFL6U_23315 [Planctomycetota bacterium]
MPAKKTDPSGVCTVSQMAKTLNLSRARFYQLVKSRVFPPPAYDRETRQPVYPSRLQGICIEVRETGIGMNGQYIRFYKPGKQAKPRGDHKKLLFILQRLGLNVTIQQLKRALTQLDFPATGAITEDPGAIRTLYQHLYKDCQKGV